MPQALKLTSRQHPIVKRFRRLSTRRDGEPSILLDGEHLVAEALAAGVPLEALLTDGRRWAVARRALDAGAAVYQGTAAVVEAASPVRTPSGIVAIGRWIPASCEVSLRDPDALAIGLVDVQDPGNVGGVIRAADALGATGVLALDRSADPGNWKALRGAMGSTFHLPVAKASLREALAEAERRGLVVAATVAADGQPLGEVDLRAPLLVLLGNEGAGLPRTAARQAHLRLTVPMRARVNSLNVAVAAALVLFEARRQRQRARL